MAYGLDNPAHNPAHDEEHYCLVVDVGARAARCTLLCLEDGIMEVITTASCEVNM